MSEFRVSPNDLQLNLLSSYDGACARMTFYTFAGLEGARAFAETCHRLCFHDGAALNVGFTFAGLTALGCGAVELAEFPDAFREGMAARAGLLGDILENHPDRWQLPRMNWPPGRACAAPINLATIDFVIQLQTSAAGVAGDHKLIEGHPLLDKIRELAADRAVQLLAVEPLRRYRDAHNNFRDHFGFRGGFSQPQPCAGWELPDESEFSQRIALGELLLGYGNDHGDDPVPASALLDHGSFLVLRKLSQNVAAFESFLQQAQRQGIDRETLKAKMMGRDEDGKPLIALDPADQTRNRFDYSSDPDGDLCPLHAHIRRSNPRTPRVSGKAPGPRIV